MSIENKNSADICNTIHSADSIDPFEGLDLNDICVSPDQLNNAAAKKEKDDNLFNLNPLDGIDLKDMSVNPDTIPFNQTTVVNKTPLQDDINFTLVPGKEKEPQDTQQQKTKRRGIRSLSNNVPRPPARQKKVFINPIIEKAYLYAELTQIREKYFQVLNNPAATLSLLPALTTTPEAVFLQQH